MWRQAKKQSGGKEEDKGKKEGAECYHTTILSHNPIFSHFDLLHLFSYV